LAVNDLRASMASLQTLDDQSQIAQARRMVATVAQACGFDEVGSGRASLVATELATNVLKHAGRGFLICQRLIHRGGVGVEILALDQGPGIGDVEGCFRDGYSTAGTAGTGLGAIRRLSHEVDLYAQPGAGTAVLARLWLHPPESETRHFAMATLILPVEGETVCGDAVSSSGHWPRRR
jgi:anti-sigma regulatory factor (Ser/Thr protein kinase)